MMPLRNRCCTQLQTNMYIRRPANRRQRVNYKQDTNVLPKVFLVDDDAAQTRSLSYGSNGVRRTMLKFNLQRGRLDRAAHSGASAEEDAQRSVIATTMTLLEGLSKERNPVRSPRRKVSAAGPDAR
mmetsp:Transcript_51760/g.127085  ORF Transcript_51760/g.127085 Transcript_51760/m.127085 type:complete len:126 (-) Transcript_51760:1118-1495(-)